MRSHRRLQQPGEFKYFGAGADRTAADGDHRILRVLQQGDGARNRAGIRLGRRRKAHRYVEIDRRFGAEHVPGRLDRYRTNAAAPELLERFAEDGRSLCRMVDALAPFGQPAQGRELIRQFMQNAAAAAYMVGLDIAGEAEHRGVGAIGRA